MRKIQKLLAAEYVLSAFWKRAVTCARSENHWSRRERDQFYAAITADTSAVFFTDIAIKVVFKTMELRTKSCYRIICALSLEAMVTLASFTAYNLVYLADSGRLATLEKVSRQQPHDIYTAKHRHAENTGWSGVRTRSLASLKFLR